MLSGATPSALAMAGTAVFRIVVSSDSMKKATATSHGSIRFTAAPGSGDGAETMLDLAGIILVTDSIADRQDPANPIRAKIIIGRRIRCRSSLHCWVR